MNDTHVTVVGNVVDSPRRVNLQNGAVTNFRLASTARRFDTQSQAFVDAGTFWVDVECWNDLSGNVSGSVAKGDPVIVQGTLTTHSWEGESGRRSTPRIRALAVGHNLNRGTGVFRRTRSERSAEPLPAGDGGLSGEGLPGDGDLPGHGLVRGRDYETAPETLHGLDTHDLATEPAHA
ncbi:single-strand DNA-binding protein [Geodermatophilus telluris]|uniref:Single-strand DNA-binding protein n=1 Tax=Geodermatophilus telluris TaxID=1190417 RepID=A0A1G6R0G6_9ACTN|nr:single-stranded DNA-binding protein [Geodermatophilus telluris]SDC97991.1 single-strand DNA-binding protein [Geodermatophilus telluris]